MYEHFTSYSFKPQLKYRRAEVRQASGRHPTGTCLRWTDSTAMDDLEEEWRNLRFDVDGQEVVLTEEDLLIDMAQTEGYVSDRDNTASPLYWIPI